MLRILFVVFLMMGCNAQQKQSEQKAYPISKTAEEWKKQLSEFEYYVLREAGTERPFSSPLNDNKRKGTYLCAACQNPLYKSEHKFNSGTGWPSFDQAIEGGIDTSVDHKLGYARKELLCSQCGGHLGHVFADGPTETTGMRHCINGTSLNFIPE